MLTRADLRWLALAYAWMALLLLAIPASGQSVTIGAGEIRHGQHGRQDLIGLEVGQRVGPVQVYASAFGRHGDLDDTNSGHPWVTALVGRSIGPIGGYAGLQATPIDNYRRWTFVAGPRLDLPLGDRWALHVSHLWRERGYVRSEVRGWTPETTFRLDWRLR